MTNMPYLETTIWSICVGPKEVGRVMSSNILYSLLGSLRSRTELTRRSPRAPLTVGDRRYAPIRRNRTKTTRASTSNFVHSLLAAWASLPHKSMGFRAGRQEIRTNLVQDTHSGQERAQIDHSCCALPPVPFGFTKKWTPEKRALTGQLSIEVRSNRTTLIGPSSGA